MSRINELEELIDKYHQTTDDDEKAAIIEQGFEPLADDKKWDFLLPLLMLPDTYDLVKVGIYRMIETAEFPGAETAAIKDKVMQALKNETDDTVRQYGFMSLSWNFSRFPDVLDYCLATIEDEQEDNDVRHNAFSVITCSEATEKVAAMRDRLLRAKGFEKQAANFFGDRHKGS